MTREHAQLEREVFNAFCDGKEIEERVIGLPDAPWYSPNIYSFNLGYEHRIKPESKPVPLGPEDVPPGSVLRWHTWLPCYYRMPLEVTSCGVMLLVGGVIEQLSFESLIEGYEISRDFGKTWQRCEKEETI